ncbi:MAG: hypothetical protein U0176_20880 [Bacteroidia bacterium]
MDIPLKIVPQQIQQIRAQAQRKRRMKRQIDMPHPKPVLEGIDAGAYEILLLHGLCCR